MEDSVKLVPVTAIVTAYQRIEQAIETIRRIESCRPRPAEILVHVDANQQSCAHALRSAFPGLCVLVSEDAIGPGGGRNRLVAAAHHEIIASFDDDSYPLDGDYFARATALFDTFPDATLFASRIFHRGEVVCDDNKEVSPTGSFGAGGVVFLRSAFMAAGGFLPLVVAYGMEEEDLALRLLDGGHVMFAVRWLRVFHDTHLSHHNSALVTAGSIANLALLSYVRYPVRYWPLGALQVANRAIWCLRARRFAGVFSGLTSIPSHLLRHRRLRQPVSIGTIRQKRIMRKMDFTPFSLRPADQSASSEGTTEARHDAP